MLQKGWQGMGEIERLDKDWGRVKGKLGEGERKIQTENELRYKQV